jgi:hypothetical protein
LARGIYGVVLDVDPAESFRRFYLTAGGLESTPPPPAGASDQSRYGCTETANTDD